MELRPFPSGHTLFLHCTVQLCLRNFEALCDPVACHVRRKRKRRANDVVQDIRVVEVTAGMSVWSDEELTASQQTNGKDGSSI